MNFEVFEQAWKNQPSGAIQSEMSTVLRSIELARRRQRNLLVVCGINSVSAAVVVALSIRNVVWAEAWPALAVQAIAAILLVVLVRDHLRRRESARRCGTTVADAVKHALADTQAELSRIKMLAAVAIVMLALMAVAVGNLYLNSKMDAKAVLWISLLIAAVIATNTLILVRRYRSVLKPRESRMQELLGSLQ